MRLKGNMKPGQKLVGRVNAISILTISAYGIAVKNGFKGTEEEWLASLEANPERIKQFVNDYMEANPLLVDTTLSVEGQAAESKATGEAIEKLEETKLNESRLPEAINTALLQAKESGLFDGEDGQNGKDGIDGKDGQNGIDGKTPVRGADYWTADDIAEIKSYVDGAILGGEW